MMILKDCSSQQRSHITTPCMSRTVYELHSKRKYKPLDEPLRDSKDISIYYRYINTELNLKSDTFKQALENDKYIENECWFNAVYDTYKDTLMVGSQRREALTREKMLDIVGKTEENVKQGLTINEMLPFFEKYKISIQIYDKFYNCIFKYAPEGPRNHHTKNMYCLIHGNHIYTLNHDLNKLDT